MWSVMLCAFRNAWYGRMVARAMGLDALLARFITAFWHYGRVDLLAARQRGIYSFCGWGHRDGHGFRRRHVAANQRGGRWVANSPGGDRGEFEMCACTCYCCANLRCNHAFR